VSIATSQLSVELLLVNSSAKETSDLATLMKVLLDNKMRDLLSVTFVS